MSKNYVIKEKIKNHQKWLDIIFDCIRNDGYLMINNQKHLKDLIPNHRSLTTKYYTEKIGDKLEDIKKMLELDDYTMHIECESTFQNDKVCFLSIFPNSTIDSLYAKRRNNYKTKSFF